MHDAGRARTLAVTPRFVLHVGYACNERCSFCYYLPEIESGRARSFSTPRLLRRIAFAAWYGKTAVDISGGEPTIHPDLPRLIERCRAVGIRDVTIITNGVRTASRDYAWRLKDAGLSDALFSLHGATAESHDALTRRPGSFDALMASLRNFRELGLGIRINTVITSESAGSVEDVLRLVAGFEPSAVNLLVFNPAESAASLPSGAHVRVADHAAVGGRISAALDVWKTRFPVVNVRFLPFCFLPRHPDAVRTQWQKVHEAHEWDPVLNVAYQKGVLAAAAATVAGLVTLGKAPRYRSADVATWLSKRLSAFRMRLLYRQGEACRRCAARRICPGLARDHVSRFGFPRVEPLSGPPLKDPLHFVDRFIS